MNYDRLILACVFGVATVTAPAHGELTAYDPFTSSDIDKDLFGEGGGMGFAGEWKRFIGAPRHDNFQITDGSLHFLGLDTDGGRINGTALLNDWGGLGRPLENPISRNDMVTKYLSFLMQPEDRVNLGLSNGFFGAALDGTRNDLFIGAGTRPLSYIIERVGEGQLGPNSNVAATSGDTVFVVMKADFRPGDDSFTVHDNPIPGQPEPISGTVTQTDLGDVRQVGFASAGAFSVDELRWGNTFEDVAPSANPLTVTELIGGGDRWSFLPGIREPSEPDLEWTTTSFDDSTWDVGQEGFGYGPETPLTMVTTVLEDMKNNYSTLYLRQPFSVIGTANYTDLVLRIDSDDAFIAYINGAEVARSGGLTQDESPQPFDAGVRRGRSGTGPHNFIIDTSAFNELLQAGHENVLAIQGINRRSSDDDFALSQIQLLGLSSTPVTVLQAGDADQDLDFDQIDLVQVQVAAKYLTGQIATWGEGDWNGAPGGSPGSPPVGDGLFNQFDVIAAQQAGTYLTGSYAAIESGGELSDGQTSVIYNAGTGELAVDAPAGIELTSINIDSAAGLFTAEPAQDLAGSFDNDADTNIFKATFGGSFGSVSFGKVAQAGLSEEFVLGDLSVVGSLAGGGDLGSVDLVYVPEPTPALLLAFGLVIGLGRIRRANTEGSSTAPAGCATSKISARFGVHSRRNERQ